MNPSSRYRTEIILLAEASFEGTLDKEQAERLDQLVCEDPQAARLYVEYMELHGELHRMHRGQAPYSPDAPILGDVLGDATGNAFSDPLKEHKPPSGTGGMMFGWLGLGAITLITSLLAAMTLWWTYPLSDDRSNESLAVVNNSADNVAKLTAVSDCDWRTHGSAGTNVGARLIPGDRLALDRGSIEVTYDTGAKVRLEGPAVYVVSSDNRGLLEEGDLSAFVPPQAIGFVVDTPAGEIIDQGTEFDITVRKDKKSGVSTADVKVIKGVVDIALPTNAEDALVRNRFVGGEAVRISSIQRDGILDPDNSSQSQEDSFDPRTIKGMRLWLRADAALMRDKQGRITEMLDLVGGANEKAENFCQPKQNKRPHWLDRGINGRSTLTFTGRQYLQLADRSDLCFYDESLTIFVVGNASDHTQYFISSGASREKHADSGYRFTTSRDCGLRYMAGRVVNVVRECPINRHNVLSVIHDRRISGKNTVALFCNGRQLGQVEPVPDSKIENAYPLTIGGNPEAIHIYPDSPQNYLHGDLAEIIVYDRVLSELEQQRIESYLITRYGLRAVLREGK